MNFGVHESICMGFFWASVSLNVCMGPYSQSHKHLRTAVPSHRLPPGLSDRSQWQNFVELKSEGRNKLKWVSSVVPVPLSPRLCSMTLGLTLCSDLSSFLPHPSSYPAGLFSHCGCSYSETRQSLGFFLTSPNKQRSKPGLQCFTQCSVTSNLWLQHHQPVAS